MKPGDPAAVVFFQNGNTGVFRKGEQVPELQIPWVQLYAAFLEAKGFNPLDFRLRMPNNEHARFFRTEDGGWNWRFE
jgi:hypothetical protein